MADDKRRLFFGAEVDAPWPEVLPEGRLLEEGVRHVTLAFLGMVVPPQVEWIPEPRFRVGQVGMFDECLLLRNVVAWHAHLWEGGLGEYRDELQEMLGERGYPVDEREFLAHVTVARKPYDRQGWKRGFQKLPVMVKGIHMYESVGNLTYEPRWSAKVIAPFEEKEHTADVAFVVRGENVAQVHLHAQVALAFKFPEMVEMLPSQVEVESLEEVIIDLNRLVGEADAAMGAPLKAVSFCGELEERDGVLEWEMIVDV